MFQRFGPQLRYIPAECRYCTTRYNLHIFMYKKEKWRIFRYDMGRSGIDTAPAVMVLAPCHTEVAFFGELKPCVVAFGQRFCIEHHIEPGQ